MSSKSINQCQEAKEAISNVELEIGRIENQGDLESKASQEDLENNNKQDNNNLEDCRFIDDEFSYLKEESLLGLNPSYYKNIFFGENYNNEKNIEDENSVNNDKSTNNNSSNAPILSIKDIEWIRLSTLLEKWNKTKLTDDASTKPFLNFKITNTMMQDHIDKNDDCTECNENEDSENNNEKINSNHINYNTREKLLKEALFQNLIFFNYTNGDFYSKKVIRSDNPITPNHYIVSELLASKFPFFILNLFQIDNCDVEKGYYELKFFINNDWKTIVIDDYIPCFRNTVKPVFYNPSSNNEIWMCLVEKAWAKINNGYINIMTSQVKLKSPFYNHYVSDFQEKNSELINLSECFLAFTGISNRIIPKESLINCNDENNINSNNYVGEIINNSNNLFYYSFLSVESDVICNGKSRINIIDTHHHYNHYYNSISDCENTNSSAHNIMRSSNRNVNSNDNNDICHDCNIQKELLVDIPLKITASPAYSDELINNDDNFVNTNENLIYKEDVELNVEFLAYNSNRNTINSIIKEKFYEDEVVYDRKFKSLNKKDNGYLVESLLITQKSNEFNNDFGDIEYLLEVNLNWKGKQTYFLNKENKDIKGVENKDEGNITYTDNNNNNNNNNNNISNNSDDRSILDLKSIFPLRIKEPSLYRYDFIFNDILKLLKKINKNNNDESSIYNKKDFFISRSNLMLVKLNSSTQNIEMTKLNKACSICSLEYLENLDNLSTISLTLFLEPGNYFLLTDFQILNDYLCSVIAYNNNLIQDFKNMYCFPEILNQLDKYNICPYFNCISDDTDSELNSLISVFFRKLIEYKNIYYINSLLNNCFENSIKKSNSNSISKVSEANNINTIINDCFYKEKSKYINNDNNDNEMSINLKELDNVSSLSNEIFILNNDIFIIISRGIDSSNNNNSMMIVNSGSSNDYVLKLSFKDYLSCLSSSNSENNNLLYDFNARLKHSFNLSDDLNYNDNHEYQDLKITIKPLETKLIIYSDTNNYYINSNFILKFTNNSLSTNEDKNKNSYNDMLNNSKDASKENLYFSKHIRINISKILYNKYNTEYSNFSLLFKNKIPSKNKSYIVMSNNNNNSNCNTKENNNTAQSSLILPIETLIQGNRQTANLYDFEENSYKIKVLNHTTLIDDILDTCNNKRDIFRNKFNKIAKKTKHVREENFNQSNYLLNSYKPENLRVNSYNFNDCKNNSKSKALYVNTICDNESINSGRSGKNKIFYISNKNENSLNNSFNNNSLMRMSFGNQMFNSINFNRISGNSNFDANNGYISSRIESKLRSVNTSLKNTRISNNFGIGFLSQRYTNDNDINTYNNNFTNMIMNDQYNPLNTEEYVNSTVQTEYLNTNESINAFNNSNYNSKNPFNLNLNSSINFNNHSSNDFNNTTNAVSNKNSNTLVHNNKSNFFNTITNISKSVVNNNNKFNNKARKLLLEDIEWNIIKYGNGIYIGELNDSGERDGIGGYFFDSGESFIGSWKSDDREGYGIEYFETGIILYEGEFKNDLRKGIGCLNLGNNDYYEGEFVDDFFDGQGIYFWDNGSCWVGRFSEGKQEGRGVCITHKGDNIVKEFKNGKVKRRKYSDSEEEIEEEMMRDFENEEYEKERNSTKLVFHKKNINNIFEKYNEKYKHTCNLSNVHKNTNITNSIRFKKLQEKINNPEVKENYYRDKVRKNFGSLFDN